MHAVFMFFFWYKNIFNIYVSIPTKFIPINISFYDIHAVFILVIFSLILEQGKSNFHIVETNSNMTNFARTET